MSPGPGFAILARGDLTLMLNQPQPQPQPSPAGAGRACQGSLGSEPPATS